jgi:hypothetical protein
MISSGTMNVTRTAAKSGSRPRKWKRAKPNPASELTKSPAAVTASATSRLFAMNRPNRSWPKTWAKPPRVGFRGTNVQMDSGRV